MTLWRNVSSARTAVASWPLPASGKSIRATVRDGLTTSRIGSWIRPVASAQTRVLA
jgi:hypothetical protein